NSLCTLDSISRTLPYTECRYVTVRLRAALQWAATAESPPGSASRSSCVVPSDTPPPYCSPAPPTRYPRPRPAAAGRLAWAGLGTTAPPPGRLDLANPRQCPSPY